MDMKKVLWQLLPIIQMKRNLTVAFDLLFLYTEVDNETATTILNNAPT